MTLSSDCANNGHVCAYLGSVSVYQSLVDVPPENIQRFEEIILKTVIEVHIHSSIVSLDDAGKPGRSSPSRKRLRSRVRK